MQIENNQAASQASVRVKCVSVRLAKLAFEMFHVIILLSIGAHNNAKKRIFHSIKWKNYGILSRLEDREKERENI